MLVSVHMSHRIDAVGEAPGPAWAGAAVCFAISGAMSMTFQQPNWRNDGTVSVVLALCAFGALAGLALIARANRLAGAQRRWKAVWLDLPDEALSPGDEHKVQVVLQAGEVVNLEDLTLRWALTERAAKEGEPQNAEVHEVAAGAANAKNLPAELDVGATRAASLTLQLPADGPTSFAGEYHQVSLDLVAEFQTPAGPETRRWTVPVQAKAPADAAQPEPQAAPEADPEVAGLLLPRADDGAAQAVLGTTLNGAAQLPEGETAAGTRVLLVLHLDGGTPVVQEVAEATVDEDGAFALELPTDRPPSWEGEVLAVSWTLELRRGDALLADEPLQLRLS